jgi:NADH:quinone reductase (non-electrogenic)
VALEAGDPDGGVITAGQIVGLIDDIPSCEELIQRMVWDCHDRVRTARSMFAPAVSAAG